MRETRNHREPFRACHCLMEMPEQPAAELALSRRIDTELVRLAREGSVSALRLIVRRHNQRLYRVARAIVRDDTEAEDVMQEAYLRAFRNLAKFRADSSLATWLTRIVVNTAVGHRPQEAVMVPLDTVDNVRLPDVVAPYLASEADPEQAAARSQVRDLLEHAIDSLPEPFRVVFVMRMVEQLSIEETASALDLRAETVKTRLHRAKKLMRGQLETRLGSALSDTFPFEGPRCASFTDALLVRLTGQGEPAGQSRQHPV